MRSEKSLAIIGWAMYYKGYTTEDLKGLSDFEILLLIDEYGRERRESKENMI